MIIFRVNNWEEKGETHNFCGQDRTAQRAGKSANYFPKFRETLNLYVDLTQFEWMSLDVIVYIAKRKLMPFQFTATHCLYDKTLWKCFQLNIKNVKKTQLKKLDMCEQVKTKIIVYILIQRYFDMLLIEVILANRLHGLGQSAVQRNSLQRNFSTILRNF